MRQRCAHEDDIHAGVSRRRHGAHRAAARAACRKSAGSTKLAFSATPKCRCGPVARPVAPTLPITAPALTCAPGRDVDLAQVAVHRDETCAVVEDHGVAVEEVVTGVEHPAVGGRMDRRALVRGDVHAAVRVTRLVVKDAPRAIGAGTDARNRRLQPQRRRQRLGERAHGLVNVRGLLLTRARSFFERSTWRGATVRRCSVYCLSATSKPTAVPPGVPSWTRTTAWPGTCASGMPTTASQPSLAGSTSTRRSSKVTTGGLPAGAEIGHEARRRPGRTPPAAAARDCRPPRPQRGLPTRSSRAAPHSCCASRVPPLPPSLWHSRHRCDSLPAGHAGAQGAAREPRLDLLAGRDRGRIAQHPSVGMRDDGEAARQGRQRTHRMQPALRQRQTLGDARQALLATRGSGASAAAGAARGTPAAACWGERRARRVFSSDTRSRP